MCCCTGSCPGPRNRACAPARLRYRRVMLMSPLELIGFIVVATVGWIAFCWAFTKVFGDTRKPPWS